MSYDSSGDGGLDYLPCRYGNSKLLFRGPRQDLSKPYIAFFGGTETYGKFIEKPFVGLLNDRLPLHCANFGCINAGIDVYMQDPHLPEIAMKSRVTVIQVTGAHNMSNRLYAVHPRRNDRFVSATKMLKSIYPDVDFAGFHFNKHLLKHLKQLSPERYRIVEQELSDAWCARLETFLSKISGKIVLLLLSREPLDQQDRYEVEPVHVTSDMIKRMQPNVTELVEVHPSAAAVMEGTDGMVFSSMEAPVAKEMLGAQFHMEIADKLAPVLERLA